MTGLDWFFVAVLLASLVLGAWRGLVSEVMSVLNWLLAFVLAQWQGSVVGQYLPLAGVSDVLRYVVGFVLVFVVAAFTGGLLVWLVTKLMESSGLRPVDRVLGAAFGVVRGVILLLAVTVVMEMTPLRANAWWWDSTAAAISIAALKELKPVLPEEFGKYLP